MVLSFALSLLLSQVVCIPWVRRPMQQLEDPSNYGLENTENFQIPVNDLEGEFIGAWFSRPSNYELGECSATNQVEGDTDEICSGSPLPSIVDKDEITVIYLHGNAETRSQQHRTELYKILQTLGYHVLAIDYRAYADSSFCWTPNESSLSHDALSAYTWLKERSHPESKVVVWGHSLGSGVTAKLGSVLSTSGQISKPDAYILESPFSSLKDEIESFYMSRLLPFDIADQLREASLEFDSVSNLKNIREPILILHAKDDKVVPFELGQKLFNLSKDVCDVRLVDFEAHLGLGHSDIYKHKDIASIVDIFVRQLTFTEAFKSPL